MTNSWHTEWSKSENLVAPQHAGDAGYDLRSAENDVIMPGTRSLIHTGIFLDLPQGITADVCSRSGMAIKSGIFVLNAPGIVDSGYNGEVCVILYNTTEEPYTVELGSRVAQIVFRPYVLMPGTLESETVRGTGGFGSTGVASGPAI